MATALTTLMTGIPIRRDSAMTGEIPLSGRVVPVGGSKEKALAALPHGVTTVIVAVANLVANLILIPASGAIGALYALLIATTIQLVILGWDVRARLMADRQSRI
jgi:ATP-dependent Lon protease